MKKHYLVLTLIASAVLLLSGCQKAEPTTGIENQPEVITTTEAMLSFTDEAEMQETILQLMKMNDEERSQWYKKNGNFLSQENFKWVAVDEINGAQTLEELSVIKEKYSKYFIFNNDEVERDSSPYIPSNEAGYSFVCNREGNVNIAGKIINFNTLTCYEETDYFRYSQEVSTRADVEMKREKNYLYSKVGDRKFWAESHMLDGFYIRLKLTSQAYGWLTGWTWYKTTYTLTLVDWNSDAWIYLNSGIGSKLVQNGQVTTGEYRGDYYEILGLSKNPMDIKRERLEPAARSQMQIDIYSRGTGTKGTGRLSVRYVTEYLDIPIN